MKAAAFWRSGGFAGLAMLLLVLALQLATDFTGGLERRFYDLASTHSARQPSKRIALIAIDAPSIAHIGPWPWPRDVQARLIDQLSAAHAKTVVQTDFFFAPQIDPGLLYIRKIKALLESRAPAEDGPAAAAQEGTHASIAALVEQAQSALDTDAVLAASLERAGNVLLPSAFSWSAQPGNPQIPPAPALPDFARKSSVAAVNGCCVNALRSQQPLALLGQAAAGVGHLGAYPDADGVLRAQPLLLQYADRAVPSLALLAALNSLDLGVGDLQLPAGEPVHMGKLRLPTDATGLLWPQYYPGQDGQPAFALDAFEDVLSGKIPASRYAGKIVIVGLTAPGLAAQSAVPGYAALSSAEVLAHTTSSILNGHLIRRPGWSVWAALGALLLVAAYVLAALPRLSGGTAAGLTVLLCAVLLGGEFAGLAVAAIWLPLVFPASALLLGHLAFASQRALMPAAGPRRADTGTTTGAAAEPDPESSETHRMLGLALHGQGQLDLAFARFRHATPGEALMGNLYSLAADFAQQRQFSKAEAVYQHMAGLDPDYKDILSKLARSKSQSETLLLGASNSLPGAAALPDRGVLEPSMLGRYQVDRELGRGAMGVVYLGRDPKIGRVVAIKTLALSQEFAGGDLADARERFFREAETAGRLQHQNIVTIFDAGEEHDLAYIAMEFLKGHDLAVHCQREQLLPVATVLGIGARVASALAYAHLQNVVHRDIKPANIMYDASSDTVKVTDFGIARITDSSKTKTGLVMGTPSFMSPEQLAGKKVDGRSDLYSLGVMLYHMLSGVLPFRGDSMSELMFKIANEEAADIRRVRPELSEGVAQVVARALHKRPEARYQTGEQLAAELGAVLRDAGMEKTVSIQRVVGGADIEI